MNTQIPDLSTLLGQIRPEPPDFTNALTHRKESEIDALAHQGSNLLIFQMKHSHGVKGAGGFPTELIEPKKFDIHLFAQQARSNLLFLQEKLRRAPRAVADAVLIDPTVMHGNPVFKGTRIPIYQIVEELADGTPFEQLGEGYPSLDPEKIRRGLDFVAALLRIYDEEIPDR